MNNWKIVVPVATANLFADPKFDRSDPETLWTTAGDGTEHFWRSVAYQWRGTGSALPDLGGGTWAALYQTFTVAAQAYTLSCYVWHADLPTSLDVQAYWEGAAANWDSITAVGGGWYRCVKTATANAGNRSFGVYCKTINLRVDACQLEALAYVTTYCDGDEPGCSWRGQRGGATEYSVRDAQSRAGGREVALDSYGTYVTAWTGAGMPPLSQLTAGAALLPGARLQGVKVGIRSVILSIWADGTSQASLHAVRQALIDAIKPDLVEEVQPFILRYDGAAMPKELLVVYDAGLEGGPWAGFTETLALRLLALDPMWYAQAETAQALDAGDALACTGVAARIDDLWNDLDSPATASFAAVYALLSLPAQIAYPGRQFLFLGGDFTDVDGDAAADYFAYYNVILDDSVHCCNTPPTDAAVRAMAADATGDLYIGGLFTSCGAVTRSAYIVKWSPWDAVVTSLCDTANANGAVYCILVARDGTVYVGGAFTTVNGVAANYIAKWNGTTWARVGTSVAGGGFDAVVYGLAEGPDGLIYATGAFRHAEGNDTERVAVWNGSIWHVMGVGLDDEGNALAVGNNGLVYCGGEFHTAGGVSAGHVAVWNGTSWAALAEGLDADCECLALDPNTGHIYAGGVFTLAGVDAQCDRVAVWNGSQWRHLDIDLAGGTPAVYAIHVDGDGNLYIGGDFTSARVGGQATATNGGTARAFPRFVVTRSGGTSATLSALINRTTGKQVLFDYDLADGETLTVDMRREHLAVTSDLYGEQLDALQPGSDFASWSLLPGANVVECLVTIAGSPTITAALLWRDTYWSAD